MQQQDYSFHFHLKQLIVEKIKYIDSQNCIQSFVYAFVWYTDEKSFIQTRHFSQSAMLVWSNLIQLYTLGAGNNKQSCPPSSQEIITWAWRWLELTFTWALKDCLGWESHTWGSNQPKLFFMLQSSQVGTLDKSSVFISSVWQKMSLHFLYPNLHIFPKTRLGPHTFIRRTSYFEPTLCHQVRGIPWT